MDPEIDTASISLVEHQFFLVGPPDIFGPQGHLEPIAAAIGTVQVIVTIELIYMGSFQTPPQVPRKDQGIAAHGRKITIQLRYMDLIVAGGHVDLPAIVEQQPAVVESPTEPPDLPGAGRLGSRTQKGPFVQ